MCRLGNKKLPLFCIFSVICIGEKVCVQGSVRIRDSTSFKYILINILTFNILIDMNPTKK